MPHEPDGTEVTLLLEAIRAGEPDAAERLLELVYGELRALAGHCFRGQPASHTLQPTALAHEAFIRLVHRTEVRWEDRAHFFAVCATAMRGILADHARKRRAAKRGGDWQRVSLSGVTPVAGDEVDAVALDDALSALAAVNERQARIVELRFFSELTIEEVAHVLDVSKRTVDDDWAMARAWLSARLTEPTTP
jgi:RNA polymerase sigma factor (TIGR02999 family)